MIPFDLAELKKVNNMSTEQLSVEQQKQKLWDAFDTAIIDLRYNNLPREEVKDLMEDAVSRVCQLATELHIDPSDFF